MPNIDGTGYRRRIEDYDEPVTPRMEAYRLLVSAARNYAAENETVTSDDLHDVTIPSGVDRRIHGAVLSHLSRDGVLAPSGYRSSDRPECGRRPIVVFKSLIYNPSVAVKA